MSQANDFQQAEVDRNLDIEIKETESIKTTSQEAVPDVDSSLESKTDNEYPKLPAPYQVLEFAGAGGMGFVYKVQNTETGQLLAAKVLKTDLANDVGALKRFEQEVAAACKLEHPNIVAVYGEGITEDGAPFLLMDYIEGKSLADVIATDGPMDGARALSIFTEIASAVSHAHREGILHRDIKPTNIILTRSESGIETARIIDFGIAKLMPSERRETMDLTETREVFGSPNYMSPEQCLGFMLDQRSDIYSFGCAMFEVVTGKTPYQGANPIQIVVKHISEEAVEFPSESVKDKTAGRMENIILRCLQKDVAQRYQNFDELIKDLGIVESGKAPPKRFAAVKAKAIFSRNQAIGFSVALCLGLVYFTLLCSRTGDMLLARVVSAIWTVLIFTGGWGLLSIEKDRFPRYFREGAQFRQWWKSFFVIFISLAIFNAGMFPALYSIYPDGRPPEIYFSILLLLNVLLMISALVSAVAYFIPAGKRKHKSPIVVSSFIGLLFLLTSISCLIIPDFISDGLRIQGAAMRSSAPRVAMYFYLAAEKLNEGSPYNSIELGDMCLALSKQDEALMHYQNALRKSEKIKGNGYLDQASLKIAELYLTMKKPDEAIKFLNESIPRISDSDLNFYRGKALFESGQYREALNDLLFVVDKKTAQSPSAAKMALKASFKLGDLKTAYSVADEICTLRAYDSDSMLMHFLAGNLAASLGNHQLANMHFEKATKNVTESEYSLWINGIANHILGNEKESRIKIDTALSENKNIDSLMKALDDLVGAPYDLTSNWPSIK